MYQQGVYKLIKELAHKEINDSSLEKILKFGKKYLKNHNIGTFSIDTELILANVCKISRNDLLLDQKTIISSDLLEKFFSHLMLRSKSMPIAQILGYKDFWKHQFYVNKSTLIPRPETEMLVESTLDYFKETKCTFADFGSGTGCIGLSILSEIKESRCFFVEKNKNALKSTIKNAKNLNLIDKSRFFHGSWMKFRSKKKLDFIVSNPPYLSKNDEKHIMKDVVDFEPKGALFAQKNGAQCYNQILKIAKAFLKPSGMVFFEIDQNWPQIEIPHFFKKIEIKKDLLGIDRVMIFKLD